jgi:hypothetical protein
VHPDHLVGTSGRASERRDRDRGRIRREHGGRRKLGIGSPEDLLLHRRVLDHRLDHQVGSHEILDRLDARQHFLHGRTAFRLDLRSTLADRLECPLRRTGLGVVQRRSPPRRRDDLGNAGAHLARSHHEHVFEVHGREPTRLWTAAASDE